jgi:hypothetical protein
MGASITSKGIGKCRWFMEVDFWRSGTRERLVEKGDADAGQFWGQLPEATLTTTPERAP